MGMAGAVHVGVLVFLCAIWGSRCSEDDEAIIPLAVEHSISSSAGRRVFTSRGTLYYRDPRKQIADGSRQSPLHTSKSKLAGQDMTQFKKLVESNGDYLIRVTSSSGSTVTAFAPACALVASQFREEWEITMDQFGNIAAINYVPKNSNCVGLRLSDVKDTAQFETAVKLAYPWRGIRPDLKVGEGPSVGGVESQGGSSNQGTSGNGDGNEEPKEEQSFLRKYWLYIAIPVVFLMMNGVPPEEGSAQGSRPGGPRAPPRRRPAGGAT